ncbi:hypothetical protein PAT3040_04171 [Paenibacillus agaridevorans]|uniref:Copper amine oxidase-like N-terminal domain-containing protein n=1 Tax=Paenibacillus agaridevorans TaxID=171404 RepID=A0A2R5F1A7_9BACL|nr:hypothetical protein [Paenibacillus agaridevorans]GBG09521.1 hypothetical protein PAT3040_04171 [Paenibacillus agaridevorans]
MKKLSYFIAGTLVGAAVMTASSALASEIKQLVGTKVGSVWELHVNGEVVGEVPIISGSSYAPVRQIAEIAGMGVDFTQGKVFLETKEDGEEMSEPTRVDVIESRLRYLDAIITGEKNAIFGYETLIKQESSPKNEVVAIYREKIAVIEARIAEYETEIVDLEAELAEIEKNPLYTQSGTSGNNPLHE